MAPSAHLWQCLRWTTDLSGGFKVIRIDEVIKLVDICITATGSRGIITLDHVEKMKSGAILCNMGHSNTEIDMSLHGLCHPDIRWEELKENVSQLTLKNNKKIILIAKVKILINSLKKIFFSILMNLILKRVKQ